MSFESAVSLAEAEANVKKYDDDRAAANKWADAKVTELVRLYAEQHSVPFDVAFNRVLERIPHLKALYALR